MKKSVFLSVIFALLFCGFAENVKGQVGGYYDPLTGAWVVENDNIVKNPQVRAEFPGGIDELKKYLADNCQYPEAAREEGWQGVVGIQFVVERDGCISNVEVIRSVYPALDDEAVRVVKSMPKWKPAQNEGHPCRSYFWLPITFSLY